MDARTSRRRAVNTEQHTTPAAQEQTIKASSYTVVVAPNAMAVGGKRTRHIPQRTPGRDLVLVIADHGSEENQHLERMAVGRLRRAGLLAWHASATTRVTLPDSPDWEAMLEAVIEKHSLSKGLR